MNKAILMGRLTRDTELRTTVSNIPVCSFTVAVDRRFKSASGERQADFISVVAWRQQAELVAQYFNKGSRILVVGSIQTRNWDDSEGNVTTQPKLSRMKSILLTPKRVRAAMVISRLHSCRKKIPQATDFSPGRMTIPPCLLTFNGC